MLAINVPTINSNDSDALLQKWLKEDGAEVRRHETIAVLETTKASFDLTAEAEGLLHVAAPSGQRYAYGTTLGWIFTDAAERDQFFVAARHGRPLPAAGEYTLTRAARELVERHGIDEARVKALGKTVVKASDLAPLIAAGEPNRSDGVSVGAAAAQPLSAQQQSIARVVSKSRATIPDAFLLKKIAVDSVLRALGEFSRERKILAGLPDLLVWIMARLAGQFPGFFGALREDLSFLPSTAGNIGVTFDVGHGLFIPVIRDAATLAVGEVARQMMQFRMRAARNSFRAEDLTSGDISISLNMDADVLCVVPVILPPQTCMLSVSAVLDELALDETGRPVKRRYVQLGAAYDHRAINGYAANAFLNAIKGRIETPEPALW